jgi:hypothetical protein
MEPPLFPIVFWCNAPEAGLIGAVSLFKFRRIKHLAVAAITELVVRRVLPFDERILTDGISHGGPRVRIHLPPAASPMRTSLAPDAPLESPGDAATMLGEQRWRASSCVRQAEGLGELTYSALARIQRGLPIDDPRWREPARDMAQMPTERMGPAARSFAADAYDCIMVRIRTDLPNTRHWLGASPLHGDERRRRPPASGDARPPG